MLVEIGLIVALVLLNGVFAGTELAMVSAKRGRLQQRADAGERGARIALRLQDEPNRLLSTVQVGITLIGTIAGAFGGASIAERLIPLIATLPILAPLAEDLALALVIILITYLSLILGELVPKRLAMQHAESIAVGMARPMEIIALGARPIILVLGWSTEVILRLLGRSQPEGSGVTEDDIRQLVREGTEDGVVKLEEQLLIERIFAFSDRPVRRIMTQRRAVAVLDANDPLSESLDRLLELGYSRFPVYEERPDNIIGVVHVRDILRLYRAGDSTATIRTALRPPLVVPDSMHADDLLRQFRTMQQHLAIIVDELGSFAGIATLEDVLEELVGDIADEYDETAKQLIIRRDDGSLLIDGRTPIELVKATLGVDTLPEEERERYETLAGFVLARFGRLPQASDSVHWEGWRFEVIDMDGLRIDAVLVTQDTPS